MLYYSQIKANSIVPVPASGAVHGNVTLVLSFGLE